MSISTPSKASAEDLSRRADELAQIRLEQLITEVNGAHASFQNLIAQRQGVNPTEYVLSDKDTRSVLLTLAHLNERIEQLKGETERIQEVVTLRQAGIKLQTTVLEAVPDDAVSSLLIYASIATIGGGGVAYGLARFPPFGYALIPALIVWGFGIAIFVIGYWNLNRWQHWKEYLFHDLLGIPRLPRRRWHIWDRHTD